jgi:putative peptide zinc metalloprotease protein
LREAASVYVDTEGTLQQIHIQPGNRVRKGQTVVTLENLDVQLSVARLLAEEKQLLAKLDSLEKRSLRGDASAGLEIEPTCEALDAVKESLDRRHTDARKLKLVAPTDGIVFSPSRVDQDDDMRRILPSWTGWPLETRNVGAHLDQGVVICRIGDPRRLEAVLAIDESQIEFVRPGQTAEILLEQYPGMTLRTEIKEISTQDIRSAAQGLPIRPGTSRSEQSFEPAYQASCHIDDGAGQMVVGGTGQARVFAGHRSLAQRFRRYVVRTFSLRS